MDKGILIAYATKYGATMEIAGKIGQVLEEAGLKTEVLAAEQVGNVAAYRAVILGSGVYIGRWRKQAVRFLQAHEAALAGLPVWIFSSGPTGEGDPATLTQGWTFPTSLQPIADRIQPRDVALFHGAIDATKLNWLEKRMIKMVGAPDGDFRDWDAITAWAAGIADTLSDGG